jgi:primosomal protein N' (replication factor Y)
MNNYIEVAIATPLRKNFEYLCPKEQPPKAGSRLLVPFGHRQVVGIMLKQVTKPSIPPEKIKPIIKVIDTAPLFPSRFLEFMLTLNNYYHHNIGDSLFTALPKKLKEGEPLAITLSYYS